MFGTAILIQRLVPQSHTARLTPCPNDDTRPGKQLWPNLSAPLCISTVISFSLPVVCAVFPRAECGRRRARGATRQVTASRSWREWKVDSAQTVPGFVRPWLFRCRSCSSNAGCSRQHNGFHSGFACLCGGEWLCLANSRAAICCTTGYQRRRPLRNCSPVASGGCTSVCGSVRGC